MTFSGFGASVVLSAGGAGSQTAAGTIAASVLDITAVGPASLPGANSVGTLDFTITGPGAGFPFRNSDRNLTLGFVVKCGGITAYRIPLNEAAIADLVKTLRDSAVARPAVLRAILLAEPPPRACADCGPRG